MIRRLHNGTATTHEPAQPSSDPDDHTDRRRDSADMLVRIQWTETTRYSVDTYVNPDATDADLYAELAMIPEAMRHTPDVADTTITSIVDLDGDGHPSVLERAISAGNTVGGEVDWGDVVDTIDTRLAEGPDWPALAATLDRAAAGGYDVAERLPQPAAAEPLPTRYPAQELQYRILADTDTTLTPSPDSDNSGSAAANRGAPLPLPGHATAAPDPAPSR